MVNCFGEEADFFYLKCATENKNPLVRFEGYAGLMMSNPHPHLRVIIYGLGDKDQDVRIACSHFFTSELNMDLYQQFLMYLKNP